MDGSQCLEDYADAITSAVSALDALERSSAAGYPLNPAGMLQVLRRLKLNAARGAVRAADALRKARECLDTALPGIPEDLAERIDAAAAADRTIADTEWVEGLPVCRIDNQLQEEAWFDAYRNRALAQLRLEEFDPTTAIRWMQAYAPARRAREEAARVRSDNNSQPTPWVRFLAQRTPSSRVFL